mmetsp:Transcript_165881/g.532584  ORF Transcript_165881/g.532584 Transcript_165881/m.532584 type:complete len:366 (-) Transcript_165881:285-1382(-)
MPDRLQHDLTVCAQLRRGSVQREAIPRHTCEHTFSIRAQLLACVRQRQSARLEGLELEAGAGSQRIVDMVEGPRVPRHGHQAHLRISPYLLRSVLDRGSLTNHGCRDDLQVSSQVLRSELQRRAVLPNCCQHHLAISARSSSPALRNSKPSAETRRRQDRRTWMSSSDLGINAAWTSTTPEPRLSNPSKSPSLSSSHCSPPSSTGPADPSASMPPAFAATRRSSPAAYAPSAKASARVPAEQARRRFSSATNASPLMMGVAETSTNTAELLDPAPEERRLGTPAQPELLLGLRVGAPATKADDSGCDNLSAPSFMMCCRDASDGGAADGRDDMEVEEARRARVSPFDRPFNSTCGNFTRISMGDK